MSDETRPQAADPTDLGRVLRALRRRADLSQRELAARAGVPKSTVARIEAGQPTDPRFGTVERLVSAAGGRVVIGVRGDGDAVRGDGAAELEPPAPVPHDELRDEAGRRYPAHLDAWEVREPKDWPGAWWAEWYRLPPHRFPLALPPATYELNREYRDRRRRAEAVRGTVLVRRVTGGGLPATCWRFIAELPDGELVGELRAHERSVDLLLGQDLGGGREMVLDGVLVAGEHRGLGIGRRLVEALSAEMDVAGVGAAHAVAEFGGIGFLTACGYRLQASRPAALRLDRPPRAARGPDSAVSAAPRPRR